MSNTMSEKTTRAKIKLSVADLDFEKQGGLLPVVAQDINTGAVLMMAYANQEAVQITQESGFAHYWSRSRGALWKKGERSGHLQKIVEVLVDCDQDTLLYRVHQTGVACHTGSPTCFFQELTIKIKDEQP